MVPTPTHSARPRTPARRHAARAVVLASMGVTIVGCANKGRFADGEAVTPSSAYAKPAEPRADEFPFAVAPTGRPIPPLAAYPAGPASNGPGGRTDWGPNVPSRRWQYIVIHHSATHGGGAKSFDSMHRGNGWDELGYHFVVGNGTDTGDGTVRGRPALGQAEARRSRQERRQPLQRAGHRHLPRRRLRARPADRAAGAVTLDAGGLPGPAVRHPARADHRPSGTRARARPAPARTWRRCCRTFRRLAATAGAVADLRVGRLGSQ